MKKILIVNPGSTSVKYKIFNQKADVIDELVFKTQDLKQQVSFLKSLDCVVKIGVRVVHGGDISETTKVTTSLKKKISSYLDFAPIHNKQALCVIDMLEEMFPRIPIYACFDTAFHVTIPEYLSNYAIPSRLSKKHKIKKYGFHGLAVESALIKLQSLEKTKHKKSSKIIFAHLGGGCSITAVKNKKSFCTSMGLTPISGIMMTTRAGDIDSDLDKILAHKEKASIEKISNILNFKSGFYGLTGSTDTLDIFNKAKLGKNPEKLAFDMFAADIVARIWAYTGLMQGIDTVVFSGGIGYGNEYLRNAVVKKLRPLGITKKDVYAIDVDEELMIFNKIKNKLD